LALPSSLLRLARSPTSTLFPYTTLFRSLVDSKGQDRPDIQLLPIWRLYDPKNIVITIEQAGHRIIVASEREGIKFFYADAAEWKDRKSTRLNSSHVSISYAVFCLKKKMY